ncbi:hypothetical protein [Lacihabitans lacunae]|uniref:Uncharacterized protein n=1 Tax=Lacihabitans lacunae TaxID=1028214 RepID=A0ABV7YX25_9BACT
MKHLTFIFILASFYTSGQSAWKIENTSTYSITDSSNIYRYGNVAISDVFTTPDVNKFMVNERYKGMSNKAMYVSLNEPRFDLGFPPSPAVDSSLVSMARSPSESHLTLGVNHYANFKEGVYFSDVHTSTSEINFFRGTDTLFGFYDGGHLAKASALKVTGAFAKNGLPYRNTEFDLLNLRFFTGSAPGNTAQIDNFYGIRLEDLRGDNFQIIKNGWGVYIKPTMLKNYFGGSVGVGTTNVTHKLTINAESNPLKIGGLANQSSPNKVLTVNADGEVFKSSLSDRQHTFIVTTASHTLQDDVEIYIHKGGDVLYTLPLPNLRTGKIWRISNVGTGSIVLNLPFYEGDALRNTIPNKAGANSFQIFSDGENYIAIK